MDDERSSSTAVRLAPGRAAVPGPWRRVRFDRVGLAVKYIDERLEEVAEIVFKPDAGEHRRSRLDGGLELPAHCLGFGERPRIGLVLAGAVPVERQLVGETRSQRCGVELRAVSVASSADVP